MTKVISIAFEQKSPKVQAEALNWVGAAIKEFGMQVNPKILLRRAHGLMTDHAVKYCGKLMVFKNSAYQKFDLSYFRPLENLAF